jgi:2-polyprenyl-6-methoxyphenol hydroxylase-like FAD-dependent oxidoreductase
VGAGPAGLVLAIELGRRGVPCMLIEQSAAPPTFPKANSTTSRTMEHYRRLGCADEIRALGLPDDYRPDISYHTHYATHELARLRWPSRREALAGRLRVDAHWPTPEPIHRGQQMLIEPVLRAHAQRWPAIDLRLGWRAERLAETDSAARILATELASGRQEEIEADYAVGCDGPRGLVRETLGIDYQGIGAEDRDFMGGRMLAVHLDAPDIYRIVPGGPSWQYWAINRRRCGVLVAIDGRGRFVLHTQLPGGAEKSMAYARESIEITAGCALRYEILDIADWTAGFTLVAERYGGSRTFLAGDAAHLFTPTAGLGYNTAVDDVSNLGWKLAAVCQGWGGTELLHSYQTERKPVAERNTRFARSVAETFRNLVLPPTLEDDAGAAARAELGRRLLASCTREFDAPGIHLGAFYGDSPIIAAEPGEPPPDDPGQYVAQARAGARAPHLWLADDVALYDRLGRDFTLLALDGAPDTAALEAAAAARNVPLTVLRIAHPDARELCAASLVLIRPDQHVAWRGTAVPADPAGLMDLVTGRARTG